MGLAHMLYQRIQDDGLRHEDVGELVGVRGPTVTRWLQGGRPDPKNHGPLAEFLGISGDDLVIAIRRTKPVLSDAERMDAMQAQINELQVLVEQLVEQRAESPAPPGRSGAKRQVRSRATPS